MSISVKIPKEITEYREKVILGLSLRQLISFTATLLICGATFFFLSIVLKANEDLVGYLVIFEAMPILAIGFFRKNGFTFEKYFFLILRHKTSKLKKPYKTQIDFDKDKKVGKYDWIFQKETKNNTNRNQKEHLRFENTKKVNKKTTKQRFKNAREEYRKAKQRFNKTA